jgi:hypothetical protein
MSGTPRSHGLQNRQQIGPPRGCLCGAVRYEINGEPMMAGHCHCLDCRKASGAAHGSFAAFSVESVKITGELKSHKTKADSGMMSERAFCPECGSWISGRPEMMPSVVAITCQRCGKLIGNTARIGGKR